MAGGGPLRGAYSPRQEGLRTGRRPPARGGMSEEREVLGWVVVTRPEGRTGLTALNADMNTRPQTLICRVDTRHTVRRYPMTTPVTIRPSGVITPLIAGVDSLYVSCD